MLTSKTKKPSLTWGYVTSSETSITIPVARKKIKKLYLMWASSSTNHCIDILTLINDPLNKYYAPYTDGLGTVIRSSYYDKYFNVKLTSETSSSFKLSKYNTAGSSCSTEAYVVYAY